MKKILYIALADLSDTSSGVSKKILSQIEGIKKLGFQVDVASYHNDGGYIDNDRQEQCFVKFTSSFKRRLEFFSQLKKRLQGNDYDIYYIRYPRSDFSFNSLLKKLCTFKKTIIVEIPTYPIAKIPLSKDNWKQCLLSKQEILFFKRMARMITVFVTIGNFVENIYGTKAICIQNGINIENFSLNRIHKHDGKLNILTVSEMYYTHGYDRLLEGLHQYVTQEKKKMEVHIYMVGDGPELPRYKALCEKYNLFSYVTFTGKKFNNELNEYYNKCDIAVAALGEYRDGMNFASPLKTKEYMARGMPFIYAYEEIGLAKDYPYALKYENNSTPINFDEMIKFYKYFIENEDINKTKMRLMAKENFDWENILKKVFERSGV